MAPRICGAILLLLGSCAKGADAWRAEISDPETGAFDRGLAAIALGTQEVDRLGGVPTALLATLDLPESSLQPAARAVLLELPPSALPEMCLSLVDGAFAGDLAQRALEEAILRHGAAAVPALLDVMPDPATTDGHRIGRLVLAIGAPATEPLLEGLRPGKRGARAAFLLGALGRRAAVATQGLIDAATSGDPDLAPAAIDSLPRVNPAGWRVEPALRKLVQERDSDVSGAAEESLARILLVRSRDLPPASRKRLELLRDALRLGDRAAESFAEGLWPEGSNPARFAADAILGTALRWSVEPQARSASPGALRGAEKRLDDGALRTRRATALEIGRLGKGGVPAIPALARALESKDWGLRYCAGLALALIAVDCGRTP